MFSRDFSNIISRYTPFPAIAILGPRQSGKTTFARATFPKHAYVLLEDLAMRELARTDPRKFLRMHENEYGIIIDEFQYAPDLLSYIQIEADGKNRPGYFILTGSQNFLMNRAITQSLAGRVGILTLLPLSLHELVNNNIMSTSIDDLIVHGGYPRIYEQSIEPLMLYPSYIQTYIERDVRELINIGDLSAFQRFLKLCAGRIGQQLNLSELAAVCGVSVTTARRWISILEASYIIFLLQPHFNNFNKRLTKSPKLYFYDTGLACSLLGIESSSVLALSTFRGSLFESLIIADLYKQFCNLGRRPSLYYWRDLNGRLEVDCIIETALQLVPIEIKSGETIASDFFDNLVTWSELAKKNPENGYLIYGGDLLQERSKGIVMGWKHAGQLVDKLLEISPVK